MIETVFFYTAWLYPDQAILCVSAGPVYDLRGGCELASGQGGFVWEEYEGCPWVVKDNNGAAGGQRRERGVITLFNSSGNCSTVAIGVCMCLSLCVHEGKSCRGFFSCTLLGQQKQRGCVLTQTESHYYVIFTFSGGRWWVCAGVLRYCCSAVITFNASTVPQTTHVHPSPGWGCCVVRNLMISIT